MIAPRRMAERLRLPLSRLAQIAHVNRNTLTARPDSVAVQTKLGEIARIIARAADLAGDEGKAIIWFKHQLISGFGKTAEELIAAGAQGGSSPRPRAAAAATWCYGAGMMPPSRTAKARR